MINIIRNIFGFSKWKSRGGAHQIKEDISIHDILEISLFILLKQSDFLNSNLQRECRANQYLMS